MAEVLLTDTKGRFTSIRQKSVFLLLYMNTTRFSILWITVMLIMTLSACSQEKQRADFPSKSAYVGKLKKLKVDERESRARRDARVLGDLLDSLKPMTYYFGFSFGLSSASGSTPDVDTAAAFILPHADTLRADFLHPGRQLFLEQQYALPESAFAFSSGREEEAQGFQHIGEKSIGYRIKDIYHNGQKVDAMELNLRRADSIRVEATYRFPIQFDTLVIPIGQQTPIVYRGDTINVEKSEALEVEFTLPVDLANRVLGNHGVLADGALVDNNSYSAFPVLGVHPDRLETARHLQTILASASAEDLPEQLEALPDSTFAMLSHLEAFRQAYADSENELSEDMEEQVELLKGWTDTYADILGAVSQQYRIAFPSPVESVYLYIAVESEEMTREFVARNNQPLLDYRVFADQDVKQYGIVDNTGNIVIPATYADLWEESEGFFSGSKTDEEVTTYALNVEAKKLEPFPEGLRFWGTLDEQLFLFKNEDGYAGLMDRHKKETIPFKYDGFRMENGIIIATASLRGRPYYHFYFLDGKQIPVSEKITEASGDGTGIFISTRDGREGRIDAQGTVTFDNEG